MSCVECTIDNLNTGFPNGAFEFGAPVGVYFWKVFANDGTRNKFDYSSTITQAEITALINHEDPSKRIYPLIGAENYTSERAESDFQEAPSKRRVKVGTGIKTVSFEIWKRASYYLRQVIGVECNGWGVIEIDECGNARGVRDLVDPYVYPIAIEDGATDVIMQDAKINEATGMVKFSYQYKKNILDQNLGVIAKESFEAGVDLTEEVGQTPISGRNMTASASSQEVVASIYAPFSSEVTGVPMKNLVAADFELFNATGSTTTAPDTAVENPDGTYTLTFPLATFIATDVLTLKVIKDGINDYDLQQSTIVAGA